MNMDEKFVFSDHGGLLAIAGFSSLLCTWMYVAI